jgi:hypothetical protein
MMSTPQLEFYFLKILAVEAALGKYAGAKNPLCSHTLSSIHITSQEAYLCFNE